MIDPGYPALSRTLSASLLWRSGGHLSSIVAAAWHGSRTSRLTGDLVRSATTSTIATIAALAGALAIVAQLMIPQYVRSGLPLAWPLTAAVLMIVIAFWPSAFDRAWKHSGLIRLSRRVADGGRESRRSFSEGG